MAGLVLKNRHQIFLHCEKIKTNVFISKVDATREPKEVSQLPSTWHFAFEKSPFPCFSLNYGIPSTSAR